jgi:hypothetical protein
MWHSFKSLLETKEIEMNPLRMIKYIDLISGK